MAVARRRSRTPVAPSYTLADVDALSNANDEPQWLREARHSAWELYEDMPMPTLNDEEWRRTDYSAIRWEEADKLTTANGASISDVPAANLEPLMGEGEGGTLVFVDGKIVKYEFAESLAEKGVIFTDLLTACKEHEDLIRPQLMTKGDLPTDGKFAALHAALWTHGVFVYVPRGVEADLPLHVVMYNSHSGATLGHVLVVMEENAYATM